MKKTLVAVAALAAVTGAMAEVKISGIFDQAVISTSKTSAAGVGTTTKSFGEDINGFSELGFSGSEDLGNGMTATFGLNYSLSNTTSGSQPTIYNGTGLGLSGAFGSINIGTSYNQNFFTNAIADASGFAGASVGQLNGNAGGLKNGILTYTAPQFAEGLTLGAELVRGATTTNAGNSVGYMAQYTNSGLLIRASTSLTTQAANATTNAYDSSTGAASTTDTQSSQLASSSIGGTSTALSAFTAGAGLRSTAWAVTYDFGMAKIYYGMSDLKNTNTIARLESTTYGVSAPIGAITIGYAYSTETGTSDGTGLDSSSAVAVATGKTIDSNGQRLLATYSFSKRTTAYFMYGLTDVGSIAGAASKLASKTNSFGIKHTF